MTDHIPLNFAGQLQLWKLNGNILENSAGTWISRDEWNFKICKQEDQHEFIYIENISENTVLGINTYGSCIEEKKPVEEKLELLWKRGEPNTEGCLHDYSCVVL